MRTAVNDEEAISVTHCETDFWLSWLKKGERLIVHTTTGVFSVDAARQVQFSARPGGVHMGELVRPGEAKDVRLEIRGQFRYKLLGAHEVPHVIRSMHVYSESRILPEVRSIEYGYRQNVVCQDC